MGDSLYGLTPYLDVSKVPDISLLLKMTYGRYTEPLLVCSLAGSSSLVLSAMEVKRSSYIYNIFIVNDSIQLFTVCPSGFINRFLSWKGFLPLGRITYCVYLTHCDYLNVFYSAMRKIYYYTILGQFTASFGVIVISFSFALVTSVTLEAYFLNLEKLLLS